MTAEAVKIDSGSVRKLLGAANPDAALLYIFISSGNQPEAAEEALRISGSRLSVATATLRQLGLWPEERKSIIQPGERPAYSENDVLEAVMALPENYREAVYLYYYEGYSVREIASLLGRSESAVNAHLSRGRQKLRMTLGGNEYEQSV